jgi:acyl dehydratase
MPMRCYEDFTVGEVVESGPVVVTADAIKAFAAQFDPQPMHLDDGVVQNTVVGGLYASGLHTVCLNMRLLVDGFLRGTMAMGSPGVDEIRYLAPVRAGDSLTMHLEVIDLRASPTRSDLGFLKCRSEMRNSSGEAVMRMTATLIFARRDPAGGTA